MPLRRGVGGLRLIQTQSSSRNFVEIEEESTGAQPTANDSPSVTSSSDATDQTAGPVLFHQHPLVKRLFGDSFQPGGQQLTLALATRAGVGSDSDVLDLVCGAGLSSLLLAHRLGSSVTGVDRDKSNLEQARKVAEVTHLEQRMQFVEGEAHDLPFDSCSFSHLICECVLCTFPDQPAAVAEMFRVLDPGGVLMLSDVTLAVGYNMPSALERLITTIAHITHPQTNEDYLQTLVAAGFEQIEIQDEQGAMLAMANKLRKALVGLKLLVKSGRLTLKELGLDFELPELGELVNQTRTEIESGNIGYCSWTAVKPTS
jgi:SAM-dependent methyltransferase